MRIFYPGQQPSTPNPAPRSNGVWPTFRKDQLQAIEKTTRELTEPVLSKSVLLGAGMGSGKTAVTCEVILKLKAVKKGSRVLIVGVRDSYTQWATTYQDQGGTKPMRRINAANPDNLQALLDGEDGVFYVGLEFLRAQDWETTTIRHKVDARTLKEFPGMDPYTTPKKVTTQLHTFKKMKPLDLLISDESHKHSNSKTAGEKTISDIRATRKVALSGTFFGNRFENAWVTATWLWGRPVIGTKGNFMDLYCDVRPVMSADGRKQLRTPGGFPLTKVHGEKHPGEYVQTLPCYVFIATPIGPPPDPKVVKVDLGPEQTRQYDEMVSQSLTWIPSQGVLGRAPLIADLPIVQRIRLRTAALGAMTLVPGKSDDDPDSVTFEPGCISSTLNAAYDVLHRASWVGRKALILTHSKPFAYEVARRIGKKYPGQVALKTGDTASAQWESDKASFMSTGGIQYVVAVISAVGTSTDGLQANCAKVLWLSLDENTTSNLQASNRIWRDGVDVTEYEAVQIVQRGTIAEGVLVKDRALSASISASVKH